MRTHTKEYYDVVEKFKNKRDKKLEELELREARLSSAYPEIKEMTDKIKIIPSLMLREIMSGSGDEAVKNHLNSFIEDEVQLKKKRSEYLVSLGYAPDYLDLKFDCDKCNDVGYIDGEICTCYKNELAKARYKEAGLDKIIEKQTFESFDLSYYPDEYYEDMRKAYESAKRYASNFNSEKMNNMLYMGKTGLGKTHLSTAIAKVVMDNGFDCVYETAQNIFTDIEYDRYNRTDRYSDDFTSSKYYECDLLIIDDLGTEVENKYNVAALYGLINTRLLNEKSTIINTNLSVNQLLERYEDRITSRLLGEYKVFLFQGKDIRSLKI